MKIQIVLFDGFGEITAFTPYEVLKRAKEAGAHFDVTLVASEPKEHVMTSFGLKIAVDDYLRLDNRPDVLIVPGGGWNHKADMGARKEADKGQLTALINKMHGEGTIIAGVCTGSMLMGAAGILQGKQATTHHLAKEELSQLQSDVLNYRIVDSGDVITCRGVPTGIDLALWIIERFAGAPIAAAVEYRMEYERRGVVYRSLFS